MPDNLISKKPQGTKAQNECPNDQKRNCHVCGGWHHPSVKHLDYVGHAATTHLILDADLRWNWEPLAFTEEGLPRFDANGGLWIKLTVDGVTRLGYGNADKKNFGDAGAREKEVIGDALRNAAMRFGLALDLWSKADLHATSERDLWFFRCVDAIRGAKTVGELKTVSQAAIAEAKARGDQEAEDEFLIEQADKMAKASPKTPPPARREPLDGDDLPY
ncbi:hypothetical protein [Roseateles sp. LKC17W]|uniref:DNA repair protein Rad52 n=1 Tax=Pelomonas margarita TaxID=3299031 RepID=A0ABW7FID5_9BURK